MLKRHLPSPALPNRGSARLAVALRPPAAHVTSRGAHARATAGAPPAAPRRAFAPLCIPTFAPAIPGRVAIKLSETSELTSTALTLADIGVLRREHWHGEAGEAMGAALSALASEHLPKPVADWRLQFVDDTAKDNLDSISWGCGDNAYVSLHKLPDDTRIGGIILTFNLDNIVHRVIGPTIENLETIKPGLGQSVLYWLHAAFDASYRALDPIDGYGWCQHQYWMGELDESMRLEEDMDYARQEHESAQKQLPKSKRTPFDAVEARKKIEIFTKADYDAKIPPWAGTKFARRPKLSLAAIEQTLAASKFKGSLDLLTALLHATRLIKRRPKRLNDCDLFERTRFEMSPYLIRWKCNHDRTDQDPLAQVYDDAMNDNMNSGEDLLDVNAVFAWHLPTPRGPGSLGNAVERFSQYLDLARAADALLLTVSTTLNEERVRITV